MDTLEKVARALAIEDRLDPDEDPNYVNGIIETEVAYPPEARLWWRYQRKAKVAIEATEISRLTAALQEILDLRSPADMACLADAWRIAEIALNKPITSNVWVDGFAR